MRRTLAIVTLLGHLSLLVFSRPCEETRISGGPSYSRDERGTASYVKADCRSRDLLRVPSDFTGDITELDLSGNKLSIIHQDDFVNVKYLRVLIVSGNSINTLEGRCFRSLRHLERLDLRNNNITSFTPETFAGLESLRVLIMSELPLTSYPTEFASFTPELRVLSLSAIGDATIPAEYGRLSRLEVLDLNRDRKVNLTTVTAAMFDHIRTSNISTLSIKNMDYLIQIEPVAFSNMSNLRSLILACNQRLSFSATVAALAATTSSNVTNVVLDGAMGSPAVFNDSAFCTTFWRNVRRLSIRKNALVAFSFNHAGCLTKLREFIGDYNAPTYLLGGVFGLRATFANLQLLSLSHKTVRNTLYKTAYCLSGQYRFNIDDYFPVRPPELSARQGDIPKEPCGEDVRSLIPDSLEFVYLIDTRVTAQLRLANNYCVGNLRYMNMSRNSLATTLCNGCRLVGENRIEIVDLSYGILKNITTNFLRQFPRLRFFNLSHNELGKSRLDFQETFRHLVSLEDINLSYNKLRSISPMAFQGCTHLRRLNLANNELTQFDINIRNMTKLEYIDLSENRLFRLTGVFTSKLDELYQKQHFELNLQGDTLTCHCESVSFVRWIRTTRVRLTDVDKLTCLYRSNRHMLLTAIPMDEFETGCDVADQELIVFGLIVVGIVICVVMLYIVRYHRWYIKYHVTLCWRQGQGATCHEYNHDALVLYFIHAANSRDQEGGVARISRWVCTRLLPRAEDEWGLRLYVGDRDDLGGASKMRNFVRGFQSSDKVVVCLTREFIDDSDCMNYLATALDSSKPLSKYTFVLFDDIQPTSVPRRLRQLLLPDSPSIQVTWDGVEDGDESAHDTFWRRMRDALMHDPDQERCRRRFDTIPLLVSIHDNNMSQQQECITDSVAHSYV
ncbi:hypothetical protein NP493_2348g00000 [Ridgeia piscesae]|uniref:TIR domain-containing protein n=1 Tax=Ridgeia piscesae TaxID=27915 RepID=A0AAD9N2J6_RIDPI|nr:hypothetical protein NP493_2348g00000 [Ridgeia piscesae]